MSAVSKKYSVLTADGTVAEFARKERAIAFGESQDLAYQVFSPSGKIVHEAQGVSAVPDAEPAPEPEEDLLGEVPAPETEEEPEQEAYVLVPEELEEEREIPEVGDEFESDRRDYDTVIVGEVRMGKTWAWIYDEDGVRHAKILVGATRDRRTKTLRPAKAS